MSKELSNTLTIIKSTCNSVISIVAGFYLRKFLENNQNTSIANIIEIAVILIITLVTLNIAINKGIDHAKWFRKLIVGKDFVEGIWLQRISNKSLPNSVPIYSIISISFKDNIYKISGESFNSSGKFTANFYSITSEYNSRVLKYPFKVTSTEFPKKLIYGYTELTFSSNEDTIRRYIGHVNSNARKEPIMVEGTKIDNKIDISNEDERKNLPLMFK